MLELLQRKHDRNQFSCGVTTLDTYLQKQAMQHAKSGVSRTFVLTNNSPEIQGYFSLSMGSIDKSNLPDKMHKKFPHHPLPIVRLARLAVEQSHQGKGIGKKLLTHALYKCYQLSNEIGMIAIVIDAKDENARQFYLQFEFDSLPDQALTLWLPVGALRKLFD